MTEAPERIKKDGRYYVRADIADETLVTMINLLAVLDAAGLENLANGVQLGQASWLVKARDRVSDAKAAVQAAYRMSHNYHYGKLKEVEHERKTLAGPRSSMRSWWA